MLNKKSLKFTWSSLLLIIVIFGLNFSWAPAVQAASLQGRILLQVQDKGQAWYVNPLDSHRYYLGRPDDAYAVMRRLGLGISNTDFNSFSITTAPARLAGRILLKVQDKGQAYYVDPLNLKLYYLGRPTDAFALMRAKGLGITNNDLATIPVASFSAPVSAPLISTAAPTVADISASYNFKYQNNNYSLSLPLSASLYDAYKNSPKVYTYTAGNESANLREVFYGLFLKVRSNDTSLDDLVSRLKQTAAANSWSDDQLAEFTLAFIQYIPYDQAKVSANPGVNSNPFFPYETLYLDKGVCSDKTFLAVDLMRKLGYGAAILDFPDHDHTALGIACPAQYSLNGTGYCYGETTNYFPLGVIPQSISNGQAQTVNEFDNLFNASNLGRIEIYQATAGKIYQGMSALQAKVAALKATKDDIGVRQAELTSLADALSAEESQINTVKAQMEAYYQAGQIKEYNNLVATFNSLVNKYNADLAIYQTKVNDYNAEVVAFNNSYRQFYQQ
ncbi:MAG: hypothetical protein WC467_01325 [Patescibacteria group bacterium]